VNNGKYVSAGEILPVLYALDNNFSKVIWSKDNCTGPKGFNEEELYYGMSAIGTYPAIYYLGAASILTGETKWERRVYAVNSVVSDPLNRIYFTNDSGVYGYNSNSMPESLDEKLFYVSPGHYYGTVISIGDKRIYFSDTQRVYKVDISQ
jgi:hypothetical protein